MKPSIAPMARPNENCPRLKKVVTNVTIAQRLSTALTGWKDWCPAYPGRPA
jgi:hypothetical protein